jgi:hypothetical protein
MAGSDDSGRINVVDLLSACRRSGGEPVFGRGERHANADHRIVEAVLPRLSIQHLPLMIVAYELMDEQGSEQR